VLIISRVMPGGCARAAPQTATSAAAETIDTFNMMRLPRAEWMLATIVT
jgi:hypothetical protein